MTKKLLALLLCAVLLCAAPLAAAYDIDLSGFKGDDFTTEDGQWTYDPIFGADYNDGLVRLTFDVRGGDDWAYAPRFILRVLHPKTKKVRYVATGIELAIDSVTYAYRKMENVDGYGMVHLYKDGKKLVQAIAKAKKINITFHSSGFTSKFSLNEKQLARFKKAAQLMLDANIWDFIPEELDEVYEEKEDAYPLKVYNAK